MHSLERGVTAGLFSSLERKLRRREKREPKRVLSYWVRHKEKDARYLAMLSDYNVCTLDTLRLETELVMASKVAFEELRPEVIRVNNNSNNNNNSNSNSNSTNNSNSNSNTATTTATA
jgi:hypothetical protein